MSTIKLNKGNVSNATIDSGDAVVLTGEPVQAKSFSAGSGFYSGQRSVEDFVS